MKLIIGLFVALVLAISGCAQVTPPQAPPKAVSKELSYVKLGDLSSCFVLPKEFEKRQEAFYVSYPGREERGYNDKGCEWILRDYKDKVIIGQRMEVGGCDSFSGAIEVKKDDSGKKVNIVFTKHTAPPKAVCLPIYQEANVWVAVDYVDAYIYETEVKTLVS